MRNCVGNFGEPIVYRKLNGILNALGMQVEDDIYSSSGVVRLCEALLATAELYELPIEGAEELEKLTIAVIQFVTIRH